MQVFQIAANQGREGMQRKRNSSQETIVQPWGRGLVPPKKIHITISLSYSAELTPTKWKMFQREGHSLLTLTTSIQVKGVQALHTP